MSKSRIIAFGFAFMFSVLLAVNTSAQAEHQVIQSDVIKVNLRSPGQYRATRYIENNGQKRKINRKLKVLNGDMCPTFDIYVSKPKVKREKLLARKRNKS
ncbi:MAG: hypothetical protein JXA77_08395 [Bacteroidales bacterium]|nr:hypothetical protein [Bacteroidales bacterium]MBN2820949.1 hypothetical protein [Bacteroidales bacterium]